MPDRPGMVAHLAGWSIRHRVLVLSMWVLAVVGAMAAAHAAHPHYVNDLALPGTDSQRTTNLLRRDFPAQAGDTDQIVLHVGRGSVSDAAVRTRVTPVLARVARLPHVTGVMSPFRAHAPRTISRDGRTAFATVSFDERADALPKAAVNRVITVARSARSSDLQIDLGGRAIQEAHRPSLGAATAIGLFAAIVVLLLTFGSAVAMGLPIITALLGLGTALALVGLASRAFHTPDFATQLGALLGLGVGIDYALFIVTRFRESRSDGTPVPAAITTAMDTAGRAVVFAGVTVIVALLGLSVLGVELLNAAGASAALAVALTMAAALTALPVLLSRFGERITRPTRRAARRRADRAWTRWAALVGRRPWPSLGAGLAIMLVLAAPALSLRLGQSDAGNDPTSLTTRRAYDTLAHGFGAGFNGPLQVVAQLPPAASAATVATVTSALRATPGIASVAGPLRAPAGGTAVFEAYPRSSPQSAATTDLVNRLRERVLPPLSARTGARLLVGGSTATGVDFAHVLGSRLPLFIGLVIVLGGLLLLVAFRSIAIPIQAAVMNLLSVGASLGVVTAVFQHGWLGGLLGVRAGPIEPFIPVILFAIAFGLSMDYEVFLVSRIHEAWRRHRDPTRAIVEGVGSTARVVTAAATIMVCVFVSFVLGDVRIVKLFGLGLASAVFLDAFVVRTLLLPSVLALLGPRTWWLPRPLERRLPRVAIEAPPAVAPVPAYEEAA